MLYKLSKKQEETNRSLEKIERGMSFPVSVITSNMISLLRDQVETGRVWRSPRDFEADGQAGLGLGG
jgi:hypothetical protein